MADYWKSQARKFCDFCKCWIADNKPSIEFHESGKKHKENVSKRLKEIHKNSAKQAKAQKKFDNDIEKMEKAAMAAYLKDVESNVKDMTANNIMHEKWNKTEGSKVEELRNPNHMPPAASYTNSRYHDANSKLIQEVADVDPFDPLAKRRIAQIEARHAKAKKKSKDKSNDQEETGSEKKQNKKSHDEPCGSRLPVTKVWYEACTQGHSYYWNIRTNESVWEPPVEGFLSLAEQAEEAKEQALQEELLQQIDKEQEGDKAELLKEQRANAEREKLKEIRKQYMERKCESKSEHGSQVEENSKEEAIPYRRDYNVSQKPQPYGSWQVIKTSETPQIDLQLPQITPTSVPSISFEEPLVRRVFQEKTVTHIPSEDSDDERPTVSFKRRKFGNKNVRKRTEDD